LPRKSIITPAGQDRPADADAWMEQDRVERAEVTSEDPDHPIEAALLPGRGPGWSAPRPELETVRRVFDGPRHVRLRFAADGVARTQVFVLRWADVASDRQHVVRQQWNFSAGGPAEEVEDYPVRHRSPLEAVRTCSADGRVANEWE
jgi:hypothetical protein